MSKIQNIKTHIKNNKVTYIVGGVCLVIGAGVTYYVTKDGAALVNNTNKLTGIVNWKNNQTIEVFVEALGDPGNIVQDLDTGIIYASQGQAAKSLGLSASELSRHLNGLTNHVKGHRFAKLGKAMVSETAENV